MCTSSEEERENERMNKKEEEKERKKFCWQYCSRQRVRQPSNGERVNMTSAQALLSFSVVVVVFLIRSSLVRTRTFFASDASIIKKLNSS